MGSYPHGSIATQRRQTGVIRALVPNGHRRAIFKKNGGGMLGLFGRRKGEGIRLVVPPHHEIKKDIEDLGKKAKFATAAGLNILANHAQGAIREHVRGTDFMLRRPTFVLNTIKRERGQDFATGSKLEAAVRIDPDPKRDFLAKHVEGGVKRPRDGRSLMVPVGIKGTGAGGVITTAQRARLKVDPRVVRIRNDQGKDLLVRFSGRGRRARTEVLFRLVPSVPLRPRLPIYDLARKAFDENWLGSMQDGIMEEMLQTLNRRHR